MQRRMAAGFCWAWCLASSSLYGASDIASTLYHSMKHHSKWKERLRKWDHAAIYWHIAGSYSPLTLVALREQGYWGWSLFSFVWLCAIAGTIVSFIHLKEHSNLETLCFIGMGLSVLVAFKHHGCRVLYPEQDEVYALRLPLLRAGWLSLSYHRCLGRADGIFEQLNFNDMKKFLVCFLLLLAGFSAVRADDGGKTFLERFYQEGAECWFDNGFLKKHLTQKALKYLHDAFPYDDEAGDGLAMWLFYQEGGWDLGELKEIKVDRHLEDRHHETRKGRLSTQ